MRNNKKSSLFRGSLVFSFTLVGALLLRSAAARAASEELPPPPLAASEVSPSSPSSSPSAEPSVAPTASPLVTHGPSPEKESESEPPHRDLRIPIHHLIRPTLGVALDYSPSPFGGNRLTTAQGSNGAMAFSLAFEYQPAFVQSFGVIGIGPSFSLYPMGAATQSILSVLSAGGQARYQLKYFRNQFLVPVIAYHAEYLYYDFMGSPNGGFLIKGPSVGLWFLLSVLEPSVANSAYVSSGVTRTYIIAQWKRMDGISETGDVGVSGGSYYFGLRLEF